MYRPFKNVERRNITYPGKHIFALLGVWRLGIHNAECDSAYRNPQIHTAAWRTAMVPVPRLNKPEVTLKHTYIHSGHLYSAATSRS